ncbi:hypothetical protein K523DRAFT_362691 [Schizophyllum commune Tattone D]|nr:hypothetical protein K523DRAFT_362691 [Schizophyllum commune Tattone D]
MDVFNLQILDASIMQVASHLTPNQKADLLLYALRGLPPGGRPKTVVENAIQACLQIPSLSPENIAKARILRARSRLAAGGHISAQEDLQAALEADPDNPEAKALLYQRSVAVEKLLSPATSHSERRTQFSTEIWREIALFLPRHELRTLLFVPNVLSRVASQLLFRDVDIHLSSEDDPRDDLVPSQGYPPFRKSDAERSADILTRIITDPAFAIAVKKLRIFAARDLRSGPLDFAIGMLTNALSHLQNLQEIEVTAGYDNLTTLLRLVQSAAARVQCLAIDSYDGPLDLSFLKLGHLSSFSHSCRHPILASDTPNPAFSSASTICRSTSDFLFRNRHSLRKVALETSLWPFPSEALAIRNLTHLSFSGLFAQNTSAFDDILTHGRQLESLALRCLLDACTPSHAFRAHAAALPFLRHFAFSVRAAVHGNRASDPDLFPAIADFLRDRKDMRAVELLVPEDPVVQREVGFGAAVWGMLPTLVALKSLSITYPADLASGLAPWLVPRSVEALELEGVAWTMPDPGPFLTQLGSGMPTGLRYIAFSDFPFRAGPALIVSRGFQTVRVIRIGSNYYSVREAMDSSGNPTREVELWPRRRALYYAADWLEWHGCLAAMEYCARTLGF